MREPGKFGTAVQAAARIDSCRHAAGHRSFPLLHPLHPGARERPSRAAGNLASGVKTKRCSDGSAPMCCPAGEFISGDCDRLLGEIGRMPFNISSRQFEH